MSEPKKYLDKKDFEMGLKALDKELGESPFIVAFAPITVIAAGGFMAVTYLQNRTATGDLDYLLAPEWATDDDIKGSLHDAILRVSKKLTFNREWANEQVSLFVTSSTRKSLFEMAEEQNIVLFTGQNIRVLAAPIRWAVERKIRRLYTATRERKAEFDLSDCLAMLRFLKDRNDGPLDRKEIQEMNMNGFDVTPDEKTMDTIAEAYYEKYNEQIF